MATLEELRSLHVNDALRNKVTSAAVIAAQAQLTASPGSVNGRSWALKVMRDPGGWGDVIFKSVLADNAANTPAQITGATDAQIQASVDSVVQNIIAAEAGL